MSVEQLEENEIDPGKLSVELESIERQLSEQSELFASNVNEVVTWKNVKESLKPDEVAIEMVRFRYFNHTFTDSVVYAGMYVKNEKSQKTPKLILIKNGSELETKYFHYYRNAIRFKMDDRFSFKNFWEPIVTEVGNSSTIYLSADGVYNQINLEAIPTGDGKYVIDTDGEYVTPLVKGKECAYVKFDEQGISKCAIEDAYEDGATDFQKPMSCHLYPVRIDSYEKFDAVNYHSWDICDSACACGAELEVKVYRFVKEALVRKYGERWYEELEKADSQNGNIGK